MNLCRSRNSSMPSKQRVNVHKVSFFQQSKRPKKQNNRIYYVKFPLPISTFFILKAVTNVVWRKYWNLIFFFLQNQYLPCWRPISIKGKQTHFFNLFLPNYKHVYEAQRYIYYNVSNINHNEWSYNLMHF